jgi:hypothetical protein
MAHSFGKCGKAPFYGHAWENSASRNVARRLGLILISDEINFT